jgi:hypothetical protein
MPAKNPEPYLEPISEGNCAVLNCSTHAEYRASWAPGVIIRLLCPTHKAEVEGKPLAELSPSTFARKRRMTGLGSAPLPRESNVKETIVLDSWTNQGVLYTINATPGAGGIITAEKEDDKTLYSRIVSKQVTREEAENLFAVDFAK